jgi:hydroxymethylpyrimidine/phosphomethylpyrimidine kinase
VKGGHFRQGDATASREAGSAIDVLAIEGEVIELRARRLAIPPVHGTGCTLASLVAGRLAVRPGRLRRDDLVAAVRWAKRAHHAALARTANVGRGLRVVVF